MPGQTLSASDWPGGRIPTFVRDLTTVAIAVISRNGQLRDANLGFFHVLPAKMTAEDFLDIRDLFLNPRFDQFAARQPDVPGGSIYRGILNLGDLSGPATSLHGVLYALSDSILMVAEHEVAGLELLRAKLLQLNDELIEQQRRMAVALEDLRRHRKLADAAMRDRDKLQADLLDT